MKPIYESKIHQLLKNDKTLKSNFRWEHHLSRHLVALNYTLNDRILNVEQLKHLKQYLKDNTRLFSPLRGTSEFIICGLVASESDDPYAKLQFMINHLKPAKEAGFKSGNYLPATLYTLSKVHKGHDVEVFLKKAHVLYKEMKSNHWFLTGGDDYALAILLANVNSRSETIEKYYQALDKVGFKKSNGLQMMSHILSFDPGNVTESVQKCRKIYDILKDNKLKVGTDYYSAIALMSLLKEEAVDDLVEVARYLKDQKGYKWLGKGMNILIASALIANESVNQKGNEVLSTTLQVSVQTIIVAQQIAMIAAISASSAAAAASSGSS